ncbi:MAG: site-2 protease family protein [Thermoguttaceae bacterium]
MVGHLIAAWYTDPENWLAILEVAIGLGFVIFVHELGHFSVARLCGVKCEKFYLGYDIAGLKLLKFRRGETEYGIGILPLGGYVKMLGQEDNPAKLREEIERAKQPASGESAADQAAAGDAELEAARQALFNPRSYLAQSVPRRMAIISAGVIMNLIFAWIMAVVAIRCFSVREPAPGVGNILPGDGAWQADIRTGDTVLEVRGQPVKSYGDILEAVALGDAKHNIPMVISRPGRPEPLHVSVKVRQAGGKPRIGIGLPQTATLNKEDGVATFAATPAAEAQPPLAGGDKLVQLDEQPIHNAAELHAYLGEHADKPLRVTVQRALPAEKGAPPKDAKTQQLSVRVDSRPMRWLGVIMEMGPISAIQDGSPAAAAGIRSGDVLRTVDGAAVADPMTLPERFRGRAGQVVKLGIERPGEGVKEVSLTLRPGAGFDDPMGEDCPLAISSLGIAYHVLNNVHAVVPGTPAAAAGLQSGDVIAKATVLALDKETLERLRKEFPHSVIVADAEELLFDETHRDWPLFMYALQTPALEGAKVELQWTRGKESLKKTLEPVAAKGWFNPDRGFVFPVDTFRESTDSWREALRWGTAKTLDYTLMVFKTLDAIRTGQVSARNLVGPVGIASGAMQTAKDGIGNLLVFLTLLSANLAVLNFLPIPILDGGHMVFLAWEGIRGKPPDERVQLALTYCGLLLILTLMVWVLGLDLHLISRIAR